MFLHILFLSFVFLSLSGPKVEATGQFLSVAFLNYPPATLLQGQEYSYSFSCTNVHPTTLTKVSGGVLVSNLDETPPSIISVTANGEPAVVGYTPSGLNDIYRSLDPVNKWWTLTPNQQITFTLIMRIHPNDTEDNRLTIALCNDGQSATTESVKFYSKVVAPAPPPVVVNPTPTPVPPAAPSPVSTTSEPVTTSETSTASDLPLYTESSSSTAETDEAARTAEEARMLSLNLMLIPFGVIIFIILIVLLGYVRKNSKD